MIFHSANNLKKKRKRKRKRKKKRKEKRKKRKEKKKKKRKEGIKKKGEIKAPSNNSKLVHTFQAWPSSF
jgi:hypothetical protein